MKNLIIQVLRNKTEQREIHEIKNGEIEKSKIILFKDSESRHYESFIESVANEVILKIKKEKKINLIL